MLVPLLLLFCTLTIAPIADDEALTWRPFDHPVTLKQVHSAWTTPTHRFSLASEVIGKVAELTLEEGDVVPGSPGTTIVIARIDDAVARHQLEASRAAHSVASGIVEASVIARRRTEISLEHLRKELLRIEELAAKKQASEKELDSARFNVTDKEVARDLALAREEQSRRELGAAAQKVLIAELHVEHHALRAPAGWRIERRLAEVGSMAAIGVPLLELADLRTVDARFHLSEKELETLVSRRPLPLRRVSGNSLLASRVRFIDSSVDSITRKRRVVVEIPAEEFDLDDNIPAGGIEVRLELEVPDASGGVRIPRRFIGTRLEQMIVKTVDDTIYAVVGINADEEAWIVLPGKLPRDAELITP